MSRIKLHDNHGRIINYVRLAVTDRCNLRCFYCMPAEGINYVPRENLLTFEEMERVIRLLASMGIEKIRITGGEPFIRKGILSFLDRLSQIDGLEQIHLTTNGTTTSPLVPELKRMGIQSVNLSLDSLDADRFYQITRRKVFDQVMDTFTALLRHGIPTKINTVVMANRNIEDIIPMAELTKKHPVSVRFIEEMPFNGSGAKEGVDFWSHRRIHQHLQERYPGLYKIPDAPFSTSHNYQIPGYQGKIGIIAAYSRTFCGTCNRIRITPKGMLKTCLYDDGVFNIRNFIRAGASDTEMKTLFLEALSNRSKNGFEAESQRNGNRPVSESMSTIGG
ncbi:MAG: GTP 3',8-cyclase MoaA [Bacteroidota bacterium]